MQIIQVERSTREIRTFERVARFTVLNQQESIERLRAGSLERLQSFPLEETEEEREERARASCDRIAMMALFSLGSILLSWGIKRCF